MLLYTFPSKCIKFQTNLNMYYFQLFFFQCVDSEVLHRWSPHVERLGLDDNFVDVTETLQRDEYKHLLEEKDVHGHTYQPSPEGKYFHSTQPSQ